MEPSDSINFLGEDHENYFNSVAPPLIQTSNFCYSTVQEMQVALKNEFDIPVYSRGSNPTVGILRKKLAALETADDCLVTASGCAAISSAIMANVESGDHIICVAKPYSWTNYLLSEILPRFNVRTTFVDGSDIENIINVCIPETKLIYLESPNSWTFEIQDLSAVATFAKKKGLLTIADNSYNTPLHQNPIEKGIDIVVHSASKYLAGHSDVVAGIICSNSIMIRKIFQSAYMTFGGIISPFDAWLILRGLRTLELRLEKSTQNAVELIKAIENHPKIDRIIYPFHHSFPQLELAKKQMKSGSGLFTVIFKNVENKSIELFCESLNYFRLAVSWGGHESLVFPALATFGPASEMKSHLPANMVRFYAGLENSEMLIKDILKSLEKI